MVSALAVMLTTRALAMVMAALVPTTAAFGFRLIIRIFNLRRKRLIIARMIRRLQAGSQGRRSRNLCGKTAMQVARAQIGPGSQQLLHNGLIAIIGSQMERGLTVGVASVHIGTGSQQQGNKSAIRLHTERSQIWSQVHLILQEQRCCAAERFSIFAGHDCIQELLHRLIIIIRIQVSGHLTQLLRLNAGLFILLQSHAVPLQITHAGTIPQKGAYFQHNVGHRAQARHFELYIKRQ